MIVIHFALALALSAQNTPGSDAPSPSADGSVLQSTSDAASPVTIRLKDGSRLVGRIVTEDATVLKIVTLGGVAMDLPRESIASIESGGHAETGVRPSDSNAVRLLF